MRPIWDDTLRTCRQQRMSKLCSNEKRLRRLSENRQLQQELVMLSAKRDMRTSAGEHVYTRRVIRSRGWRGL